MKFSEIPAQAKTLVLVLVLLVATVAFYRRNPGGIDAQGVHVAAAQADAAQQRAAPFIEHARRRLELLQSWLDKDPTLTVLVGSNHTDRSGLGYGNAIYQWNNREAYNIYITALDGMILRFQRHNGTRVRYGKLTNNPEERVSKREIVVWGANAGNYNLPSGTQVEGGMQASFIGLASVWEFGIITTPKDGLPPDQEGAGTGPPPPPQEEPV